MFVSIRFVIDHLANEGNGDVIGSLVLIDGRICQSWFLEGSVICTEHRCIEVNLDRDSYEVLLQGFGFGP